MVKTANITAVSIVSTRHVIDLLENVYHGVKRVIMEKGVIKVNFVAVLKLYTHEFVFIYVFMIFFVKDLNYVELFDRTYIVNNYVVLFVTECRCRKSTEKSICRTCYTLDSCIFHSHFHCSDSHSGRLCFPVVFIF